MRFVNPVNTFKEPALGFIDFILLFFFLNLFYFFSDLYSFLPLLTLDFVCSFSLKKKYFWLCWVFVALCGLSLVAVSGGYSLLWFLIVDSLVAEHRL